MSTNPRAPRHATLEDFSRLEREFIGPFFGVGPMTHANVRAGSERLAVPEGSVVDRMMKVGVCQVKHYEAGQHIFQQGEDTRNLPIFIVMPGGVYAVKHIYASPLNKKKRGPKPSKPSATEKVIQDTTLIIAIDTFGLMGDVEQCIRGVPPQLIMRGLHSGEAKATITAMTDSYAMTIEGEARDIMLNDLVVVKNVLRLTCLKLLRRSSRGDALQVYDPHEAIGALIKRLAFEPQYGGIGVAYKKDVPSPSSDWPEGYCRLNCPIQQEDWAKALGLSSQSVRHIFDKLDGSIKYFPKGIIYIHEKIVRGERQIGEGIDIMW